MDWLEAWRRAAVGRDAALARFDRLPGLDPEAMLGRWRGRGLAAGHPLDGVLEALGWWGKAVEAADRVHPLLFRDGRGGVVALKPALMPAGVALRWPGLAASLPVRRAFAAARPLLRARRPGARLERRVFRGREGAAIVYRGQPIVDHLRRIDADRVLGLMERRGDARPYFFLLERAG